MTVDEATALIRSVTAGWETSPDTDVVWSGTHEGRPGIRMSQRTRDFTTVWFTVGERTVRFEAYLLPAPPHEAEAAYRRCLDRNWSSWPATVAVDGDGDLHVVGHLPLATFDADALDMAVGAVHETVDRLFRPLIASSFRRR